MEGQAGLFAHQHAINEGVDLFIPNLVRDVVAEIGVDDRPRLAAMRINLAGQALRLCGVCAVILCAVEDQRRGFNVLREKKDRARPHGLRAAAGFRHDSLRDLSVVRVGAELRQIVQPGDQHDARDRSIIGRNETSGKRATADAFDKDFVWGDQPVGLQLRDDGRDGVLRERAAKIRWAEECP